MLDKEQPTPEANGDAEPVLEVPDGFPEGKLETKAMSERLPGEGFAADHSGEFSADVKEIEPQQEKTPSADEQPDSD